MDGISLLCLQCFSQTQPNLTYLHLFYRMSKKKFLKFSTFFFVNKISKWRLLRSLWTLGLGFLSRFLDIKQINRCIEQSIPSPPPPPPNLNYPGKFFTEIFFCKMEVTYEILPTFDVSILCRFCLNRDFYFTDSLVNMTEIQLFSRL